MAFFVSYWNNRALDPLCRQRRPATSPLRPYGMGQMSGPGTDQANLAVNRLISPPPVTGVIPVS
jgi:hypothetical protein